MSAQSDSFYKCFSQCSAFWLIWRSCDFWQPCLSTVRVQSYQDESYVPMASPSPSVTVTECDGYIPMSPRTMSFLNIDGNDDSPSTHSSLMCQPGAFGPPPIHRHLKPRLRRGENQLRGRLDHNFLLQSIRSAESGEFLVMSMSVW